MTIYRISGVWKDDNSIITHYAFHRVKETSVGFAEKKSKADAVALLNNPNNSATTWLWNYSLGAWIVGSNVHVVEKKYLRANHDGTERNNLDHLIDYDWLRNLFR